MSEREIILGTRGSALALAQAEMTESVLAEALPKQRLRRNVIKTTGDKRTDVPLSQVAKVTGVLDKGVFTKELEVALLAEEVDIAVHSMKDVPTVLDDSFTIAGVLERAPVRDALLSRHPGGLSGLPEGAVVATSSVRRQRQLLWLRPDLKLVDIRGNVPTRIEKLSNSDELGAIMLAEAGLVRLNYDLTKPLDGCIEVTCLDEAEFLPAAGQGIVGFEIRTDDGFSREVVQAITHAESMIRCRAEREFLRLLDAGCHTPVGVVSGLSGDSLTMSCRVFEDEGNEPPREATASGASADPEAVANALFSNLS